MRRFVLAVLGVLSGLSVLLTAVPGAGDTIHLTNGQVIKGRVVEETGDQIRVEMEGLGVTLWLDRTKVERIEESQATPTPAVGTPSPEPERPSLEIIGGSEKEKGSRPDLDKEVLAGVKYLPTSSPTATPVAAGRITVATGVVELRAGDGRWIPVRSGRVVFPGEEIRTGKTSAVTLALESPSGSTTQVQLMAETSVVVDPEALSSLELTRGRLWSQTKAAREAGDVSVRIKSPVAVAAIRGESSLVAFEVSPDGRSFISLFEGLAKVGAVGGSERELEVLQRAVFGRDGTLEKVDRANAEAFQEWIQWSDAFLGVPQAELHERYASLVEETNRMVRVERQWEVLSGYADGIKLYRRDLGRFPPADQAFQCLAQNLERDPRWQGPYLEDSLEIPPKDIWGTEIEYVVGERNETEFVVLRSWGPNRKSEGGRPSGDDVETPPIHALNY